MLEAVRQSQLGRQGNITIGDARAALKCCLGAGCLKDHQVGPVAIHIQRRGQRGNRKQVAAGISHLFHQVAGVRDG